MTDKEKQKRRTEKREEIRKKWEPVWTILNLNANERDKLIALHQIADPQSGKNRRIFLFRRRRRRRYRICDTFRQRVLFAKKV